MHVAASLRATVDYWVDTQGRDQLAGLVDNILGSVTLRAPD